MDAHVLEHGEAIYIVSPLAVASPSPETIKGFAFGEELAQTAEFRKHAPNPNIMWLHGQYVEADNANANRMLWTANDLAIASITPRFMPITVMHDPATAVGFIADTRMLTPEKNSVPRARIDNELALWQHRFPDVAEEVQHNAANGMLMQSMECLPESYDCETCGMKFHPMPFQAEREMWCAHLNGDGGERATRILRGVTFTGTGLIFGSRGARGAYKDAFLEVEELAAFHDELHRTAREPTRSVPRMGMRQIDDDEYARLIKERDDFKAAAEVATTEKSTAEKAAEDAEAAKVKAETEAAAEKKRADELDEKANEVKLRDERVGKFGKGFKAKLEGAETTSKRLAEQAGKMSDEDWDARLTEVEELLGVKRDSDEGGTADPAGGGGSGTQPAPEFTEDEVAGAGFGSGGGGGGGGDTANLRTVATGLARSFGGAAKKTAKT